MKTIKERIRATLLMLLKIDRKRLQSGSLSHREWIGQRGGMLTVYKWFFTIPLVLLMEVPVQAGVCRTCVKQQVVAPYIQPQVQYFVGAPLRQQAVQTYQDNYQEFQQFRAWQQNQRQQLQAPPQVHDCPTCNPQPQLAPEQHSVIKQNCSKCHSGDNPKGDLWLDGTVPLNAEKRDRIMRKIYQGKMPPKNPLDDETLNLMIEKLYGADDD